MHGDTDVYTMEKSKYPNVRDSDISKENSSLVLSNSKQNVVFSKLPNSLQEDKELAW